MQRWKGVHARITCILSRDNARAEGRRDEAQSEPEASGCATILGYRQHLDSRVGTVSRNSLNHLMYERDLPVDWAMEWLSCL